MKFKNIILLIIFALCIIVPFSLGIMETKYVDTNMNDNNIINASQVNSTEFYQDGNNVLDSSDESNLDVNSANYWDSLNTPSDINTGDLTDDGTFITDAGLDTLSELNTQIIDATFDQSVGTTDAVIFTTVDTGQGANELYDMNQNVLTTSDVTFDTIIISGSGENSESLIINAPDLTTNAAFTLQEIPLSTGTGDGKVFQIKVTGESYGRGLFYSDGSYGIGNGTTFRDVYLQRSAPSTFRIDSDKAGGEAHLEVTGTLDVTTLNTGQGDNELYDMNQNVQTTDDVTFDDITSSGEITQSSDNKHCLDGDTCSHYIMYNSTSGEVIIT